MSFNWLTVAHARTAARCVAWIVPGAVRRQYSSASACRPPLPPSVAKLCEILGRADVDFPYERLRLDHNKAGFNFVNREDQMRDVLETWLARFIAASSNRMDNPLSVIYSGPGAGKSRFLDELADFPEAALMSILHARGKLHDDQNKRAEFVQMLQNRANILAVNITFNSNQNLNISERSWSVEKQVVSRILHLYFFPCTGFMKLSSALNKLEYPEMDMLLDILSHFAAWKGIDVKDIVFFLGVDETLKSRKAEDIASFIGALMDEKPTGFFCSAMTALSVKPLEQYSTNSGRPVKETTLLALKFLPKSLGLQVEQYKMKKLLVSDCAGHARSLEHLSRILTNSPAPVTFQALSNELVSSIGQYFGTITFEMLIPIILQKHVVSHAIVAEMNGIKWTADNLIQSGVYLTPPSSKQAFIPEISPLALMSYAQRNREFSKAATCLHEMFKLSDDFELSSDKRNAPLLGKIFENYHAHWEVLRRLALGRTTIKVSEYYSNLAMFSRQTAEDLPSFESTGDSALQELTTWFPVTQTLQKSVEQNENKDPADDKGLKSALKLLQDSPCNVFKPAPGNPGFDLVSAPLLFAGKHQKSIQFDTPVTKDCIYLCLELKYSHQSSSTVLKLEEIEKKKNLVDNMFKQAKIDTKPVLVLVAARSLTKGLDLDTLPDNVVVISRPELVKLYGASFKSRPLFYLS